jgi:hypothetical protein
MLTLHIFAVMFNYDFAIKTIEHWISLDCTLLCRIQPENLKSFIHLHFFSFYETRLIQIEHLKELVSFKAAHPPPLLLQLDNRWPFFLLQTFSQYGLHSFFFFLFVFWALLILPYEFMICVPDVVFSHLCIAIFCIVSSCDMVIYDDNFR